jgi:hypothetical protein
MSLIEFYKSCNHPIIRQRITAAAAAASSASLQSGIPAVPSLDGGGGGGGLSGVGGMRGGGGIGGNNEDYRYGDIASTIYDFNRKQYLVPSSTSIQGNLVYSPHIIASSGGPRIPFPQGSANSSKPPHPVVGGGIGGGGGLLRSSSGSGSGAPSILQPSSMGGGGLGGRGPLSSSSKSGGYFSPAQHQQGHHLQEDISSYGVASPGGGVGSGYLPSSPWNNPSIGSNNTSTKSQSSENLHFNNMMMGSRSMDASSSAGAANYLPPRPGPSSSDSQQQQQTPYYAQQLPSQNQQGQPLQARSYGESNTGSGDRRLYSTSFDGVMGGGVGGVGSGVGQISTSLPSLGAGSSPTFGGSISREFSFSTDLGSPFLSNNAGGAGVGAGGGKSFLATSSSDTGISSNLNGINLDLSHLGKQQQPGGGPWSSSLFSSSSSTATPPFDTSTTSENNMQSGRGGGGGVDIDSIIDTDRRVEGSEGEEPVKKIHTGSNLNGAAAHHEFEELSPLQMEKHEHK